MQEKVLLQRNENLILEQRLAYYREENDPLQCHPKEQPEVVTGESGKAIATQRLLERIEYLNRSHGHQCEQLCREVLQANQETLLWKQRFLDLERTGGEKNQGATTNAFRSTIIPLTLLLSLVLVSAGCWINDDRLSFLGGALSSVPRPRTSQAIPEKPITELHHSLRTEQEPLIPNDWDQLVMGTPICGKEESATVDLPPLQQESMLEREKDEQLLQPRPVSLSTVGNKLQPLSADTPSIVTSTIRWVQARLRVLSNVWKIWLPSSNP